MDRSGWIEHRRGDRELVGWMRPEVERFVAVDLLGREVSGPLDWLEAEELLEALGIGYLADIYQLAHEGRSLRVRITEVSTERIRVKKDDFGAIDVPLREFVLPWPAPPELQPRPAK